MKKNRLRSGRPIRLSSRVGRLKLIPNLGQRHLATYSFIGSSARGSTRRISRVDKSEIRSTMRRIQCPNCTSVFSVHVPQGKISVKCPVCKRTLEIERIILQESDFEMVHPHKYQIRNRASSQP